MIQKTVMIFILDDNSLNCAMNQWLLGKIIIMSYFAQMLIRILEISYILCIADHLGIVFDVVVYLTNNTVSSTNNTPKTSTKKRSQIS